MLKQKTEPEGWQSNHEGSTDKALYTQLSLSLSFSYSSPLLSPWTNLRHPEDSGITLHAWGFVPGHCCASQGIISARTRDAFPVAVVSLGYLPPVPPSPLPSPPFPRLYVPSSTCIRAKLSRPISLFSPPLFFLSSKVRERKKKLEKETEKDPAEAIFAD